MAQAITLYHFGHRQSPWLRLAPIRQSRTVVIPVLRYVGSLAVLSATSTICSASDALVIGALAGGTAVTAFRIGSMAPLGLIALLYLSFGVLFPRIVRSTDPGVQEEGIAWIGRVVGWSSGVAFAGLCLDGPALVHLLLGRQSSQATLVLWITAGALCVDVSYHGVVQVLFARAQQGFLAKYTWIELPVNLTVTIIAVDLFGAVGSATGARCNHSRHRSSRVPLHNARALGKPRQVDSYGGTVWIQSIAGASIALGLGIMPILQTQTLVLHTLIVGADGVVCFAMGLVALGPPGRSRLMTLVHRSRFDMTGASQCG